MIKYNSSMIQNILVGFICFACPGMFNALNGMGGGGQVDPTVASQANTALYTTFSIFGILGGAITNLLGPKLTIFIGSLTYVLYTGAMLAYGHITETSPVGARAFTIIAGALLGVGAGMLWSAQGALMLGYPTENEKGKYISIFWIIFNMGGVIGGLISFGVNYTNPNPNVTDSTYIAFMCIMFCGSLLSLSLLAPAKVIKSDGRHVETIEYPSAKTEIAGVLKVFTEWKMILLIPLFLTTNWLYTYQFNAYNGVLFNVRTRSLNNVVYWGSQMFGAYLFGLLMDFKRLNRKTRAIVGLVIVFSVMMAMWAGGYVVQLQYTRETEHEWVKVDFQDSRYGPLLVLYLVYGFADAILQSWAYWLMGAQTNDASILARYAGFYKGIQSAGGAISWGLDSGKLEYMPQLLINWILLAVACIPALIVAFKTTQSSEVEAPVESFDHTLEKSP
ncbi:MFS general substrate transporter [Neoconidiobolus thromboides FSU 785]|nr:MFS general substrate transporter [Neoconidiobolus thromboides FSU 785]